MTNGAGINLRAGTAKRVNRQLALYARASAAEAEKQKDTKKVEPVRLVKLNNPRSSRDDGRAFDGLHLNGRGYRAFASMLYEVVGPMMVASEWKVWKTILTGAKDFFAIRVKSRRLRRNEQSSLCCCASRKCGYCVYGDRARLRRYGTTK